MNKRYPSGKSAGFAVLIWGVLALMVGCCFFVPGSLLPWVLLGTAVAAGLLLWVWFGTWYEFREHDLLLRCGPFFERIPYERITQATPTTGMLSSMALSSRMIELRHGANYVTGTTLISPEDQEGFLAELRGRCLNIQSSESKFPV